jgi:hypothetical protein
VADRMEQVAEKLERTDAIRAHARDELNIDMDELANPWQAAFTSMLSFFCGSIGPLLVAILVTVRETPASVACHPCCGTPFTHTTTALSLPSHSCAHNACMTFKSFCVSSIRFCKHTQ